MTSTLRRALAFALVGTIALAVPVFATLEDPALATVATAGPFLAIAAFALSVDDDGVAFELFARPGDRRDGKLYGLAGFTLASAGLAIVTVGFGMPEHVFVGTVLLVAYGNLGDQAVRQVSTERVLATAGFVVAGFGAASLGQLAAARLTGTTASVPRLAFIAASGALLAALLRAILFQRDDPLVMAVVAILLWLFTSLTGDISTTRIAVALGVTVGLGYVSYALETASLPGMLTGVLLGLWTIVLGDYGWFGMLIAFFGIGGLAAKYRYEDKKRRGIAEENEGARGSSNVLANSMVALAAVLAAAASTDLGVSTQVFLFAFAGSVAAAMSDTLSSELGGLFDDPRLITTLETVEPGTDGAVTWQGELAGVGGAGIIAAIGLVAFETVDPMGAGVIVAAGVAGMTVDSLLGATVEGWLVGNQGVNFLATLAGAIVGGGLAVGFAVVPL